MRKRIVIGLLILSGIGIAVFFLSQPKPGTVEWHKEKFLSAFDQSEGKTWSERIKRSYHGWTKPSGTPRTNGMARIEEMGRQREALFRLGYLVDLRVTVSNRPPNEVRRSICREMNPSELVRRLIFIWENTNATERTLLVMAPTNVIGEVVEIVRKADLPEIGK